MNLKRILVLTVVAIVLVVSAAGCEFGEGQKAGITTVKGTIWEDDNQNGIMSDDEVRLNDVVVVLYINDRGKPEYEHTTDSTGTYQFDIELNAKDIIKIKIKVYPTPGDVFTDIGREEAEYASHVDKIGNSTERTVGMGDVVIINAGVYSSPSDVDDTPPVEPEEEEPDTPENPLNEPEEDVSEEGTTTDGSEVTIDDGACGSKENPIEKRTEIKLETGETGYIDETLRGMYNPYFLVIPPIYADGTYFTSYLAPFFSMEYNVGTVTLPDCEGGCKDWSPEKMRQFLILLAVTFQDNPCAAIMIVAGYSSGADLGMWYLQEFGGTYGIFVGPGGGFAGVSPLDVYAALLSLNLPFTIGYSQNDPQVPWNDIAPPFTDLNAFQLATDGSSNFLRYPNSDEHLPNNQDLYDHAFELAPGEVHEHLVPSMKLDE